MSQETDATLRKAHVTDEYGTKLAKKTEDMHLKADHLLNKNDDSKSHSGPAGGYDETRLPDAPPGYTIRITFHRAENLPFSDFPSFSTDPYIHATFKTDLQKRHKQDPDLFLRTPTIHRNTDPKWNTQWVIAHVPASGFHLKCRLYDEDPSDHDDRLGNVHVNVDRIWDEGPNIREHAYELKKRMASKRAYTFRGAAALLRKGVKMNARLIVSVENLGPSPGPTGGRCFTVAPLMWVRHHSPLIGRIAGTKDREESKDGKKSVEKYNFQAVQMQLKGPVPEEMYHRYVEFKPFVSGMFTDVTLRGRIMNRAAHHQHARIYNYDSSTIYGIFEKPCIEMTKQFLEFVHYDQGGRIYTYVLSLDGLWRFTETGKEFGIDMLSKHTMHSDVSIYIAFSGEFFIRRLRRPNPQHASSSSYSDAGRTNSGAHSSTASGQAFNEVAPPSIDHENDENSHGEHTHDDISKNPSHYELIIDNDSGTYRPNGDLLSFLREYMSQNLPGLRVATIDSQNDSELMDKLKGEQRDRKAKSGKQITYLQNSSMSSLSSSDEEKLEAISSGQQRAGIYKRGLAKMQLYRARNKDGGDTEKGSAKDRPSDHDSRDAESSRSAHSNSQPSYSHIANGELNNTEKVAGGYENDDLPGLLRKDADGHLAQPQESSENDQQNHQSNEPSKGENKPAGGLVYNKVLSGTAVQ